MALVIPHFPKVLEVRDVYYRDILSGRKLWEGRKVGMYNGVPRSFDGLTQWSTVILKNGDTGDQVLCMVHEILRVDPLPNVAERSQYESPLVTVLKSVGYQKMLPDALSLEDAVNTYKQWMDDEDPVNVGFMAIRLAIFEFRC